MSRPTRRARGRLDSHRQIGLSRWFAAAQAFRKLAAPSARQRLVQYPLSGSKGQETGFSHLKARQTVLGRSCPWQWCQTRTAKTRPANVHRDLIAGLYFPADLRDNGRCEDVDYGDRHFQRRSLIAALADLSST